MPLSCDVPSISRRECVQFQGAGLLVSVQNKYRLRCLHPPLPACSHLPLPGSSRKRRVPQPPSHERQEGTDDRSWIEGGVRRFWRQGFLLERFWLTASRRAA